MAATTPDRAKPGRKGSIGKGDPSSFDKSAQPKDIMEKKGYYDKLMQTRQEFITERERLDKEIEVEHKEVKTLEAKIKAMQEWLTKAEPAIETKREHLRRFDRNLDKLQDMLENLTPRTLARRVRFMNLPMDPFERAAILRDDYAQLVLRPGEPSEPPMHLSATPRGKGIEAVKAKNKTATCSGGLTMAIRVYSSSAAASDPPVIVFFHGGGYVCGDLDTCSWLCRALSAFSGATVVAVDYRRAPEHKFPAATIDAYEAVCWVASGGLGFQPRKIAVAGDSAGGGLAAGCCLRARDDPEGPAIAVQILAYPWLDLRADAPTLFSKFADGRCGLFKDEVDWYREVYAPPGADPDGGGGEWTQDPRASPMLAESLEGLPRTFLAYAVKDMLAEDSESFAKRLSSELGPHAVHTMRLEGPEHHFLTMGNSAESHAVVSAAAAYASAVLWSA